MAAAIQKQENSNITLTITIPKEDVQKTEGEVTNEFAKSANIPGFRKGKAPKKLVEEKLDKAKVREEVLKRLLPKYYVEAVNAHHLRPVINPQIHVQALEEGKDWQFQAVTCEAPEVKLGSYRDAVQKVTAGSKIIVPGKEKKEPSFDEIMQAVLKNVTVTMPEILVANEVERLLAQMLDEIKTLGLTLDQYLSSTHRTVEGLREEYKKKAESDITLEFTLQKIAEVEKITVEEKEITEAIAKAKDDNERQNLEKNRYLLASILRQQKTLDFLKNL